MIQPPDNWMRVLAIDPGTHKAGALCAAIPPEKSSIHVYAEIMLANADAHKLGSEVAQMMGPNLFHTFIIDFRAGRQTPMGFSKTVAEHYAAVFFELNLESYVSGHGFEWGSDNVEGRELSLKKLMRSRGHLPPLLKVHRNLVQLDRQLTSFFYKKNDPTKRDDRGKVLELVHCLEYIAGYFEDGLFYEPPVPVKKRSKASEATIGLRKIMKRLDMQNRYGAMINPVG